MNKDSRIFVAGHGGLVGSALCRVLKAAGFSQVITVLRAVADLTDPVAVKWLFSSYQPEYVFLAAARVGGIVANSMYPVEFMAENLKIQINVMENAKAYGVRKLLFLGSACAYPKFAENPISEASLLTGALEPSNECYALAKISGVKLCGAYRKEYGCDFISAMPTNLYGVGDTYHLQNSHVIPGMIRRIHDAKQAARSDVALWGTGKVTREFLYADDLAEACLALMEKYSEDATINVGYGSAVPLDFLAQRVAEAVGYSGKILWDHSRPDGTPNRRLDSSRIFGLGWSPKVYLREGLQRAYADFVAREII